MNEINLDDKYLGELRKGTLKAFDELYDRYFRMVDDLVRKLGGSPEEAQDIFQEVLFVFVKKLREPDFRLSSKISTLLYAIARNIYLKKAGKASFETHFDPQVLSALAIADPEPEGLNPQEKEQLLSLLSEKLAALEEGCRNIILYSFYQHLSQAQIAALTGYSEAFVKVKKYRCLDYLRRAFRDSDGFRLLATGF